MAPENRILPRQQEPPIPRLSARTSDRPVGSRHRRRPSYSIAGVKRIRRADFDHIYEHSPNGRGWRSTPSSTRRAPASSRSTCGHGGSGRTRRPRCSCSSAPSARLRSSTTPTQPSCQADPGASRVRRCISNQSIVDARTGENVFSSHDGAETENLPPFRRRHAGAHVPSALVMLAPLRQFLPPVEPASASAPVNTRWGFTTNRHDRLPAFPVPTRRRAGGKAASPSSDAKPPIWHSAASLALRAYRHHGKGWRATIPPARAVNEDGDRAGARVAC